MTQDNQGSAGQEPEDFLDGDPDDGGASEELGQALFGDPEGDVGNDAGNQNEGLNVDLSSMTDEEVAAFAAANPAAIRGRVGMQSANTQRSQDLSQREQGLNTREEALSMERANLQELLASAGGQPPPQPQDAGGQPQTRTIADARDVNDALQIQQDNILQQVDARFQAATEAAEKSRQADAQRVTMTRQIEDGFTELNENYPATRKNGMRQKIEKVMSDKGILVPAAAYLYMNEANIRARHTSELEAKAKRRKTTPATTKPTKTSATGAAKPQNPAERKAAVLAYAMEHPQDFTDDMLGKGS